MDRRYSLIAALLLLVALAFPPLRAAPLVRAAAPAYYSVTDLGTLGGELSRAAAVNNSGQVVGDAATADGEMHAFRWSGSVMTDLGVLQGAPGMVVGSWATDVDATGRTVGAARVADSFSMAVEFGDGGPRRLTESSAYTVATDTNDSGQIVGGVPGQGGTQAALWEPGQSTRQIGSLGGVSTATGINSTGQVVGYSTLANASNVYRAFLWTADGGMRSLGTLGGDFSWANDINDAGQVVGWSDARAFLWTTAAGMRDLGLLPGFGSSQALAINSVGQVVGYVTDAPTGPHAAFFYAGVVVDLNDMLPADSGWVLHYATDINDGGQIVGSGTHNGQERGFLLSPTGAPGTFWDVGPSAPYAEAVAALAARGVVLGTRDGSFRPGETTLRAQLAALVARSIPGDRPPGHTLAPPDCAVAGSWDCEDWGNDFKDRGGLVADLWRNVGTLQHYGVAQGYDAATFGPNDPVTHAQAISLITRALVAAGIWEDQPGVPLPYPGAPAAHADDIRTFAFYTQARGGVPDADTTWDTARWNAGATRGWVARALWAAIQDLPAEMALR